MGAVRRRVKDSEALVMFQPAVEGGELPRGTDIEIVLNLMWQMYKEFYEIDLPPENGDGSKSVDHLGRNATSRIARRPRSHCL
jgi:hypothetical protein